MGKMIRTDPFAARIQRLLDHGSIPASALSTRQRRRLQPLFDSGVLEEQRAGSGRRISVRSREALGLFGRKLFPSGLTATAPSLDPLPRASAVLTRRDAKVAAITWAEPVLLRGFGNAVLISPEGVLSVADLTAVAGLAAFRLDPPFRWSFTGRVAVAENLEFFLSIERLETGVDLVIYGGGRLSRNVLSWLSSDLMAGCRVIHCGDYDPAGIEEFLRLERQLGKRAELYVPEDLEPLLRKYGKADLVRHQTHILSRIRSCTHPEVRKVIRMMEEYGLGLEQEVLLLT